MAMTLRPSRIRITQAIYFGKQPGFGVTSISGGNGIVPVPNPIITTGILNLGALTADWTAWAATAVGPHYDILARNVGRIFNVKAYGALGDSSTDDHAAIQAAVTDAQAVNGVVLFPRSSGYYRTSTSILIQDAAGICLLGEGTFGSQIAATTGAPSIIVVDVIGTGGSGSVKNIIIKDLGIVAGASGTALRIQDCLHFSLQSIYLAGGPLSVQGSGNGTFYNVESYAGFNMGNGGGALTNSGPNVFHGCQFVTTNSATPAMVLTGDLLACTFNGCQFQANGGTHAATVQIDGGTLGVGSVEFFNCHGESNYNGTNTGVDFLIGSVTKFGHVGFYGGNYWGHGNGTNYQASWLKIVAAADVVVEGTLVSKLGNTNGYNTAMVRLESTFPAAGDTYRFSDLKKTDINGSLYSDASGLLTALTGKVTNGDSVFTGNISAGVPSSGVLAPAFPITLQAQHNLGWEWYPAQAASRNWGFRTDVTTYGDFTLLTSSAQTTGLLDLLRLQVSPAGNFGIGVTPTRTLDLSGTQRFRGIAAPSVSEANSGTIYFDSATNRLMASLNGGAYVPILGSGGLTGSGAANKLAYWATTTSLTDEPNITLGGAQTLDVAGDINQSSGSKLFLNGLAVVDLNSGVAIGGVNGTLNATDIAVGSGALANDTGVGGNNIAIGLQALALLTSGLNNTAVGELALNATTGNDNVALGTLAGLTNTTGSNNIFIGSGATIAQGNSLSIGGGIQLVGIGVSTPKTALQVGGSFSVGLVEVTLVNGLNSELTPIVTAGALRIVGPTGVFSIGGFNIPTGVGGVTGPVGGQLLHVVNLVAFAMTIVDEDLATTAIYRIKTMTGSNVTLRAGFSAATFMYDDTVDRWCLMSSN
jgi:hypothetical protein